eukprot:scaffold275478_cov21-Tisochrysis_lutea.AAC.1
MDKFCIPACVCMHETLNPTLQPYKRQEQKLRMRHLLALAGDAGASDQARGGACLLASRAPALREICRCVHCI